MSKLQCKCGHVVSDQTDDLSYKGEVIADQDWEGVWGAIALRYASRSDELVDFITSVRLEFSRDVYECQGCGRLWVQEKPGAREFLSFAPEFERGSGVLRPVDAQPVVTHDVPAAASRRQRRG